MKNITTKSDLTFLVNHTEVATHAEGVNAAENFFNEFYDEEEKEFWSNRENNGHGMKVSVNLIKTINDEDSEIKVYECYVDSGSVDYFYFSYEA